MTVFYPTVRRLTRDFAGCFERVHVMPLGLFLPPSDIFGVIEKRPRVMAALMRLEQSACWCSPLAMLSDHYWIEFRRR
ncbi:hypothetical protein HC928_18855 [bacterium]|nr:hypothetical protein [bacterium]